MSTVELINECWAKEKPDHWHYEKYMCIHCLKAALSTPNLSTKKCCQFNEVFAQDTKPWKFKITNNLNKFQDISHTLEDAHQFLSQPWAHGSYWYHDGVCPRTPGTLMVKVTFSTKLSLNIMVKSTLIPATNGNIKRLKCMPSRWNIPFTMCMCLLLWFLWLYLTKPLNISKLPLENNLHLLNNGPFVGLHCFSRSFSQVTSMLLSFVSKLMP